jgi:rhamnosyltransferase
MFGPEYSRENKMSTAHCEGRPIDKMITSGMLLNLLLVEAIGWFDEQLFIDLVDYDYCIRAQQKGYFIIQFSNIHLYHEVGKEVYRSSIKTLFLVKKKKDLHSPLRCYYMYRNMLYLEEKYKSVQIPLVKEIRGIVMGNLKACIYYGRNTWKIIKYMIRARKDFNNMKMGKIEEET